MSVSRVLPAPGRSATSGPFSGGMVHEEHGYRGYKAGALPILDGIWACAPDRDFLQYQTPLAFRLQWFCKDVTTQQLTSASLSHNISCSTINALVLWRRVSLLAVLQNLLDALPRPLALHDIPEPVNCNQHHYQPTPPGLSCVSWLFLVLTTRTHH